MRTKLQATRDFSYGTRRLKAGQVFEAPRAEARLWLLTKRAQVAPAAAVKPPPPVAPEDGELAAARAEYERVVGKKPFYGWDAAMLREKIAAADES